MFKVISITLVLSAITFFFIGGLLTWAGIIPVMAYATAGGIIGSIASTIGLLAFASPRLTDKDVLSVEGQLVQRLADATTSVQAYENRISENIEEIQRLERDRLEIEILVRQASVKVFLEEKMKRLSDEIENHVLSDVTLVKWLTAYEQTKLGIAEIDGQITSSERAELIMEVIGDIQPANRKIFVEFGGLKVDLSPVLRVSERLANSLVATMIGR